MKTAEAKELLMKFVTWINEYKDGDEYHTDIRERNVDDFLSTLPSQPLPVMVVMTKTFLPLSPFLALLHLYD